eukprot:1159815-Pelagomonas_calceolata.AAC.16
MTVAGGARAPTPVGDLGFVEMTQALEVAEAEWQQVRFGGVSSKSENVPARTLACMHVCVCSKPETESVSEFMFII